MCESLGVDRYLALKPSIVILSRNNLTATNETETQAQFAYKNYGLHRGNFKKDITKTLSEDDSLHDAILIDDDRSYIHYGQQNNFLHSPHGKTKDYSQMQELTPEIEFYEQQWEALFYHYNSIFYLAGVLADCLDHFEKKLDLQQFLFNMHFKKSEDVLFTYVPSYDCLKNRDYYQKGLDCLRTVKANLCFVSPDDYRATTEAPLSTADIIKRKR